MSADEVRGESSAAPQPARTGPRHAAPRKPLFTRFQVPAGRAIAVAAMPTAILLGMGLTPKLALADDRPTPQSLTAEEYEDCVELLKETDGASPSPSASASETESEKPSPSASATGSPQSPQTSDTSGDEATDNSGSGDGSSSDSGSDDEAEPAPSPSASADKDAQPQDAEPAPSASESGDGGVLGAIGDTITGVVDGITGLGKGEEGETAPKPSPTPTPSSGAGTGTSEEDGTSGDSGTADDSGDSGKDTDDSGKDADPAGDSADEPTDAASDPAKEAEEAADEATASPTPSPSVTATVDPDDCPLATDVEGGIDNEILLPDDPWFLDASSLKLKGADYQGIVKVKTASGNVKEVLKYVISDGTDIGDLHQTVKDEQSGKTYHVQADKGSMSTITDGDTVMYTEKISGNLFGLIPITFSPDNPPPLNIPLIYFTNVKVQQAGQFGGTLHVPGLSSYITD
ncbi:hypothetical protein ACIP2X_17410 [Streptomyces sp. NPDC089424]|uniref:hypothetical protein n=1 Tax=Streptomyces sp. NPDC089424 TaxID=3365917 RepID=UPI0038295F46